MNDDKKDVELNDAFARLEQQVSENAQNNEKKGNRETTGLETAALTRSKVADKPTSTASGGGISGILGLLLALIALGVASFGAYTAWQLQEQVKQTDYRPQIDALNGDIRQVQNQLTSSDKKIDLVQAEVGKMAGVTDSTVAQVESRVAIAMADLKRQLGTSSEDWLLAEAEYLLRLANQRVAMEDDVAGAIALFESADKIVSEAQGVVAFELRQSIANDIAALRSVADQDIQGMFVRLGAIAGQIDSLEQKHLKFTGSTPEPVIEIGEQTFVAKAVALLKRGLNRILSQVDYRSGGEAIRPILPPQEEYYLKQNLLLKLQLAQLGLLKGNQGIYEQSLKDAVEWVDQYFDAELPLTKSVRQTLSSLSTMSIERELPDVSGSLREIRKLMARFHESSERGNP